VQQQVVINTGDAAVNVTFTDPALHGPRQDYVLTRSGDHGIALNGNILLVSGEWGAWVMPPLEGVLGGGSSLVVGPNAYLFAEFPSANASACV
jgi:hypothetical protein